MERGQISKYKKWYQGKRKEYEELAYKVYSILEEILDAKNIDYYAIDYRAKEMDSFTEKLERGIVKEPKQMQDLSGIRVITYLLPDVEKVSEIIRKNFVIDKKLSRDKSDILGEDKVGYQSVHFVARLSNSRLRLAENQKYKDMWFEIQVRTILQHAWAEIEHDKKYKFSGKLPEGIPRRFNLISGLLEQADYEFEHISNMIEQYSRTVKSQTKTGHLDIPINSTSLTQYLLEKFGKISNTNLDLDLIGKINHLLKDLEVFNIQTLAELDKIIPKSIVRIYKNEGYKPDLADVVLHSLIAKFKDEYFKKTWADRRWTGWNKEEIQVLKVLGADMHKFNEQYMHLPDFVNVDIPK